MVGKGTITMRETRILEFKETITNTFLKTVSAFSNYNGGTILFGVDDNGNVKGLPDVKQACLDIENKINDSISPQPNYTLEIQNNNQTIKLTVKSGLQKPYLYKSKAYKRNDTATIEVDTLEFSRLVLDGRNISFEELPCKDQQLSFEILHRKLKENIQIETFNLDTLKTLNLYNNVNGFNNAAGLLADKNHFSGIDIVKFGENISIIQKRVTFENVSVLEVYERVLIVFRDYYQYEIIQGADRKMMEKISEVAFREVIYKSLSKTMLKPISEITPLESSAVSLGSPSGSFSSSANTFSMTPSPSRSSAVSFIHAAASFALWLSFHKILANPSGERMEYIAFSSIQTSLAVASASAPPLPPSPMIMDKTGTESADISEMDVAIASPCPCSSASIPQ